MNDPIPAPVPKALLIPSATVGRELATFVETGLISTEQQKALTIATTNLQVMKAVSSPVGGRHFNRIDTLLSVRLPTPVSQARDALSSLAVAWDSMSADFHTFRALYFEARLRRAKLTVARKKADDPRLDDDERLIVSAECELESAKIDQIEATVAKGHAALKGQVTKATAASDQYSAILRASGKAEFTEEDFRQEEIDYYLQSAWWHVSQVFGVVDIRNKRNRPGAPPDDENLKDEARRKHLERLNRRVDVKHDTVLYFQSLGISQHEIEGELKGLLEQRESFDMVNENMSRNSNPQSFAGHFEGWVKRTAEKYRGRAVAAVGATLGGQGAGMDKLRRITTLIDPNAADKGTGGDVKDLGRRGMTE